MKPRLFRVSVTLIVIVLSLFIVNSIANSSPFEYASDQVTNGFMPDGEGERREIAYFLWSFRQLDAIALAFLMLGSVACCSAIIGEEETSS